MKKSPFIFPCESDDARSVPKVNNAHDRAVRDSKVAPLRLYDLRHTWATRAAMSGIDLVTLAAMPGHSGIQMVLRYAHPTQDHQTAAMERLRNPSDRTHFRDSRLPLFGLFNAIGNCEASCCGGD